MPTIEVITIDREELKQLNSAARRKAQMENRGQQNHGTKVQKSNKRYSRNLKHRGFINE